MRLKIEKYNQKCNVILNVVKDLNTQTVDFKILHFVQNDKMLVPFHFEPSSFLLEKKQIDYFSLAHTLLSQVRSRSGW